MKFRSNKKPPLSMDVTPLVDVVFLLLIFFMVTTTFSTEKGIKLDLPKAKTAEKFSADLKDKDISVKVDTNGLYYIDGVLVSNEQLPAALLTASHNKKDMLIHVQADKNSSHGSIVHLMDTARRMNLTRFSLITSDQNNTNGED
ncbi:MAG: biopolymer transporter ExbD [Magnetococcales bacterium]|nr:biopolymer transporter ExbD [Magnetococcales bacterium]